MENRPEAEPENQGRRRSEEFPKGFKRALIMVLRSSPGTANNDTECSAAEIMISSGSNILGKVRDPEKNRITFLRRS